MQKSCSRMAKILYLPKTLWALSLKRQLSQASNRFCDTLRPWTAKDSSPDLGRQDKPQTHASLDLKQVITPETRYKLFSSALRIADKLPRELRSLTIEIK